MLRDAPRGPGMLSLQGRSAAVQPPDLINPGVQTWQDFRVDKNASHSNRGGGGKAVSDSSQPPVCCDLFFNWFLIRIGRRVCSLAPVEIYRSLTLSPHFADHHVSLESASSVRREVMRPRISLPQDAWLPKSCSQP